MFVGSALAGPIQNVQHDIADEMHAGGDAFGGEIGDGGAAGAEEQVGKMVGSHTIDFFGHAAIETAQTSFDVGDGNMQL